MTLIDKFQHPGVGLSKFGEVSIALSGGSSPVALYEGLSSIDLNWARIRVTLIDDRLVPADHDDSNQKRCARLCCAARPDGAIYSASGLAGGSLS